MSHAASSSEGAEDNERAVAVSDQLHVGGHGERQSVSELVKTYGDSQSDSQKRDRSESGDPMPAGKRGARDRNGEPARSPSTFGGRSFKDHLDAAIEGLESRVTLSLSRDLHEFRETLMTEIDKLNERVKDLEKHVEERDGVIAELQDELHHSRKETAALLTRVEEAEINSRLPCLILSGPAMASRRAPRLEPPLAGQTAPGATAGSGSGAPAEPADLSRGQAAVTSRDQRAEAEGRRAGESASSGGDGRSDGRGRAVARGGGGNGAWEQEDINALVVATLNQCMPGLNLAESDIDRAHRLPGPNHRVIVRFVRSGQGSVRDAVMARRLELRGKDLYINESLTRLRGLIFRSLLAAKREKKIYTVYSRGGQVYFKEQQFGVGTRVDSLQRLTDLGYTVIER
ncbi:hypothetical protein FJT64_004048 [Amphibalanus amphitrite]|uniref:Uncharacterized protein n=1 Tax=Amphibalanus amphitrite TaxID=1232801 RepID=A0A6A4VWN1_AMPAM|nr:hypothetical protein FJT64_004048 [Amphibalanus amphitrite]